MCIRIERKRLKKANRKKFQTGSFKESKQSYLKSRRKKNIFLIFNLEYFLCTVDYFFSINVRRKEI